DRNVTGVQTCALPIWRFSYMSGTGRGSERFSPIRPVPLGMHGDGGPMHSTSRVSENAFFDGPTTFVDRESATIRRKRYWRQWCQIGRAACRERMEIGG